MTVVWGKNNYQDKEIKSKANKEVEDFLKQNNIVITLILKKGIRRQMCQE